jgi:ABC-type multidrug transport system ATPase subunit
MFDEPSANLDIKARLRVWKAIQHLRDGRTIIIATQIIEEAEALCERICILKEGEILALNNIKELKKQHCFDLKLEISPIILLENENTKNLSAEIIHESFET